MKSYRFYTFYALAFIVSSLLPIYVNAAYQESMSEAVEWLESQQNEDGSWGDSNADKAIKTIEAVKALYSTGEINDSYNQGIAWIRNHLGSQNKHYIDMNATSSDYLSRVEELLHKDGDRECLFNMLMGLSQYPGWGLKLLRKYDSTDAPSAIDTAIVLHAWNEVENTRPGGPIDFLVNAQLGNGSWPINLNGEESLFATSWAVISLSKWAYQGTPTETAVNNAVTYLSSNINGVTPVGEKALAAYAVYVAGDTSLANNWLTLIRSAQNGNGSWNNSVRDTSLILRAMAKADGLDTQERMTIVDIPDPKLRAAINAALGRNQMDNIRRIDLARVTNITAVNMGIYDLTGLEWAYNLETLDVRHNEIESTAPIDDLQNLTYLYLKGNPVTYGHGEEEIPTLPEWGMILMSLLLILSAFYHQRRNQF